MKKKRGIPNSKFVQPNRGGPSRADIQLRQKLESSGNHWQHELRRIRGIPALTDDQINKQQWEWRQCPDTGIINNYLKATGLSKTNYYDILHDNRTVQPVLAKNMYSFEERPSGSFKRIAINYIHQSKRLNTPRLSPLKAMNSPLRSKRLRSK